MFFVISKLLSIFLHPFSWVLLSMIVAVFQKEKKKSRNVLIAALLIAFLFSNGFVFHEVNRLWEVPSNKRIDVDKKYDVGIVLGGMLTYNEESQMVNFQENIDRLLIPVSMYKNGKIDRILFSGGSGSLVDDELEADVAKAWLKEIDIPTKDLLIENSSRNTHENAVNSTEKLIKLYKEGNFLLITSAIHMRRAQACFKKAGLQFDIFPVDHMSNQREYHFDDFFVPQSYIMDYWKQLLHEWLGTLVYKMKGYC